MDAKDSTATAISHPRGQPQQREPTAESELKYSQLFKPFHLQGLLLNIDLVHAQGSQLLQENENSS